MIKCLIVKLLNQKLEGAWTKVHNLNHPASTFSCIPMSVVGMPLPSAGPNAECGSVHIIMHLQPNTSCPPSPAQPSPAQQQLGFHQSNPVQVERSQQSAAADQDYHGGTLWQTNKCLLLKNSSNTMSAFCHVRLWGPLFQQLPIFRTLVGY